MTTTCDDRLYATFRVDGVYYGVDALHVQEVLRQQPMTTVPLAPDEVRGLINLRGQVVVALDLRRRLGLAPIEPGASAMNVVVSTEGGPVSFLVDEIGDVIEVPEDRLEPAPQTVTAHDRDLLTGIHEIDGELLLILDIERTASLDAPSARHRFHPAEETS